MMKVKAVSPSVHVNGCACHIIHNTAIKAAIAFETLTDLMWRICVLMSILLAWQINQSSKGVLWYIIMWNGILDSFTQLTNLGIQ